MPYILHTIYEENNEYIQDFLQVKELTRLKGISMHCGCDYSSFSLYDHFLPYSRYEHSIGVALIVEHFTHDKKQVIAGLLHDIASPAFSHTIDFFNGDYTKQESTEEATKSIIEHSEELQNLLNKYNLTTEDVCDYHKYPIADNDSPRLSADRLEYTLGNIYSYGFGTIEDIQEIYQHITIAINEDHQEELCFDDERIAERFAMYSYQCGDIYSANEDRYAMESLANLLRKAISFHVITADDFYLTEQQLITKLLSDAETKQLWHQYTKLHKLYLSKEKMEDSYNIQAKLRYIDPIVKDKGRISSLSDTIKERNIQYVNKDMNIWMKGE